MLLLSDTNQKVVWLHISVEEVTRVDELDSLQHLIGEHQHGFERKLPLAVVEEVLETGSQQIDNHHVVVTFDAKPMHVWNTNYEKMNRLGLVYLT